MTAVKDHAGGDHHLYVRNFDNDLPSPAPEQRTWAGQATRVAKVALPYLSLYQPISKPLTLAMGTVRSLQSAAGLVAAIQSGERLAILRAVVELAVAVASVAGTIFAHPAGMVISTVHDLVLAIAGLVQAVRSGDREAILQASLQVASSALYLALIGMGGMHLMIASTAMQIAIGAVQSRHEWAKGNYLEALGQLGMVVIRGKQAVSQIQTALVLRRIRLAAEERARTEEAIAPLKELLTEQQEMIQKLKAELEAAKEKARELEDQGAGQVDRLDKQSELAQAMAKHANNAAGCTALQHAVIMQDHKAVDLFLEAGASPVAAASHSGSQGVLDCLVLATAVQDPIMVRKFLDLRGFDQRIQDAANQHRLGDLESKPKFSSGLEAFPIAIMMGNKEIINIFKDEFSRIKIPLTRPRELDLVLSYFFYDLLYMSARFGRDYALEDLLSHARWLDILQNTRPPNYPSHWATQNNRADIRQSLYRAVNDPYSDSDPSTWYSGMPQVLPGYTGWEFQNALDRLPRIGPFKQGWWSCCAEETSLKGRAYCRVLLEQRRLIEMPPPPPPRRFV